MLTFLLLLPVVVATSSIDGVNLTPSLKISPKYYELKMYTTNNESVWHTPNRNGNRLRIESDTVAKSIIFQIFVVNNGYLIKYFNYRDMLCLNSQKQFKMLTRPSTNNLPNDCIVFFENMNNASDNCNNNINYKLFENKNICIDKNTSTINNCQFVVYALFDKTKYYLKITKTSLTSTRYFKEATVFKAMYQSCLSQISEGLSAFVCYINKETWPCNNAKIMDHKIDQWKKKILKNYTTNTNNLIHTIDTTTTITSLFSNTIKTTTNLLANTTKLPIYYFSTNAPTTSSWFDINFFGCNNINLFGCNNMSNKKNTNVMLIINILLLTISYKYIILF
ncbi:ORF109 [Pieris rapae granulovirus]|nr:ORF109 [Pieris rapae granulovirus]